MGKLKDRKIRAKTKRKPAERSQMLKSISIQGFRGIDRLRIDGLAPLTVLIGDNGAGKSTVLEAAFALYGRLMPSWVLSLQARRGMLSFSNEGPSYLGLFYGSSESGPAVISGRTADSTEYRLEIERQPIGTQAITVGVREQAASSEMPTQVPSLRLRASKNGEEEGSSELIWKFTPPNQGEVQIRNGRNERPYALLQPPSDGALSHDDRERFGDARETGLDAQVLELVQQVDSRIEDIEFLQTSRSQYFRAKLKDGATLPLGMLGGGVVNIFRMAINLAFVKDGLLAIDEVENGIYHRRLPDCFKALLAARKQLNTQLMLATHSFEALTAILQAAEEQDVKQLAVVHLRRDDAGVVRATVIRGVDAIASLKQGYDLR